MNKTFKGNVEITKDNVLEWEKKLKNVEAVMGNLYIYSNADLKALKSVGGYLYIYSNVTLNNLKSVGGNLYIYSKIDPTLARRLIAQYSTKKSWYLSNETNESILSANLKTATYKIRGVEFKKELFDKVRKDKLSAEEVFALENLEQRRIAYELMDKVKMKALDNYKILDTVKKDGKGKKMEIVSFTLEDYTTPFKYLHCIDASTDREYFVETKKDTCNESKAASFGLPLNVKFVDEW